ncbi:MAG: sulfite exporter TauE/SafE family protein [Gammaproteobacteria bacterium]
MPHFIELLALIVLAAALYSAVGQGGGSGYLAAMVLLGLSPAVMKPAALAMNMGVTALALMLTGGLREIPPKLFAPLAVTSIPAAAVGGYFLPETAVYALLVGVSLLIAAGSLFWGRPRAMVSSPPGCVVLIPVGLALGLLSGLTGVGGGIFLSPLVLLMGWAPLPNVMSMSAAFIFLNSAAALAGFGLSGLEWPQGLAFMMVAALVGSWVGIRVARPHLGSLALRRLLAGVLVIAALRLILGAL